MIGPHPPTYADPNEPGGISPNPPPKDQPAGKPKEDKPSIKDRLFPSKPTDDKDKADKPGDLTHVPDDDVDEPKPDPRPAAKPAPKVKTAAKKNLVKKSLTKKSPPWRVANKRSRYSGSQAKHY